MPLDNSLKVEESWMTGDDFFKFRFASRVASRLGSER